MSVTCCAGRSDIQISLQEYFMTELFQKDLLGSVHFVELSRMQNGGLRIKHCQKLIKITY